MKKKLLLLILLILLVGLATANMMVIVTPENKDILEGVGKGIGEINKTREVCENDICVNETYIDTLKLLDGGCDGEYCYSTLYEDGGINKEFKVELERICQKEGICEELGESYECCLEWRDETDDEIMIKTKDRIEGILNNIASVTLERESRNNINKFDDNNIEVS